MIGVEYKQLVTPDLRVDVATLNDLGKDGWILRTTTQFSDEVGTYGKQAGHYCWTFSRSVFN